MRLFDCTLRDGANVVGNGFCAELTKSIIGALLCYGIQDIEFGNAKGMGAYTKLKSAAPLTDQEYMELAAPWVDKGRLGMFLLATCAEPSGIRMAKEKGLQFIRVGADAGDGKLALEAVKKVKAEGLMCRYSLMKAYILKPEALAKEAAFLEGAGVDAITVMDSAGQMTPEDVRRYIVALKSSVGIPVGFHGHNNLGLSQANALAAAEAHADEVDGGLLGMARSVGNCSTELAAAVFKKLGLLDDVDLYGLLDYLEAFLIPAMTKRGYHTAIHPTDLVLGLAGCHSSFLGLFERISKEAGLPVRSLITEVSKIDQKAPAEGLIRKVALQMQPKP